MVTRARRSRRRRFGCGAPHGDAAVGSREGSSDLASLIVSTRTPDDLYYAAELRDLPTTVLYTRRAPEAWPRPAGRLTSADLPASIGRETTVFICGSSGFSDAATEVVMSAGVRTDRIRVERFGPTR